MKKATKIGYNDEKSSEYRGHQPDRVDRADAVTEQRLPAEEEGDGRAGRGTGEVSTPVEMNRRGALPRT